MGFNTSLPQYGLSPMMALLHGKPTVRIQFLAATADHSLQQKAVMALLLDCAKPAFKTIAEDGLYQLECSNAENAGFHWHRSLSIVTE